MPTDGTRLHFTAITSHLRLEFSAHPGLQGCGSSTRVPNRHDVAIQEVAIHRDLVFITSESSLGSLNPAFSGYSGWLILDGFKCLFSILADRKVTNRCNERPGKVDIVDSFKQAAFTDELSREVATLFNSHAVL